MVDSKKKAKKPTRKTYPRARWQVHLQLWFKDHQWQFLFGLTLITLCLGCIGFKKHTVIGKDLGLFDVFYRTLQLFVLHSVEVPPKVPWELEVARFSAPAIAAYAAVITLMAILREQVQLIRLRFIKNHIVICGLGRIGVHLARTLHESGQHVVVIEKNAGNSNLAFCREHGIINLIGDATDQRQLNKAQTQKASYLFCVCNNDGTNVEVAVVAQETVSKHHKGSLTCFIHIIDLELCKLLREKKLLERKTDVFRWEFFNIFETGARRLLNMFPPFGEPSGTTEDQAHLLIVGLGHMGESLVMRAIRDWRNVRKDDSKRMRITMIDRQANTLKESLYLRYPQIDRYCDLMAQQLDMQASEFLRDGFLVNLNVGDVTTVYVCSEDDSLSFSSAVAMHRHITAQGKSIPIVVRMSEDSGLAKLLKPEDESAEEFKDLHTFCLLEQTCRPDLLVGGLRETMARAMHEDYVRNEARKGETPKTNPSMVPWEYLPEDLKDSNRYEADCFVERLKPFDYQVVPLTGWDAESFEFPPEILEEMAEIEHDRWCSRKRLAGYTFAPGQKTDRTHPDLLSWDQLPQETKEKDRNIVRGLPQILAQAGFQIIRISKHIDS